MWSQHPNKELANCKTWISHTLQHNKGKNQDAIFWETIFPFFPLSERPAAILGFVILLNFTQNHGTPNGCRLVKKRDVPVFLEHLQATKLFQWEGGGEGMWHCWAVGACPAPNLGLGESCGVPINPLFKCIFYHSVHIYEHISSQNTYF